MWCIEKIPSIEVYFVISPKFVRYFQISNRSGFDCFRCYTPIRINNLLLTIGIKVKTDVKFAIQQAVADHQPTISLMSIFMIVVYICRVMIQIHLRCRNAD